MAHYIFKDFGLKVEVPDSAPKFFSELVESGGWERYECEIISKVVKPGHRVLEGGAGLGVTSALIGKRAAFAISFEANQVLAKSSRVTQKLNGSKTKIINGALGAKDGSAIFSIEPDWWTSKIVKRSSAKTIRIRKYDVQKIINKYNINALILDVEGGETEILPRIDLSLLNLLIIELHGDIDKSPLISLLKSHGLKLKNNLNKADHSVVWFERPSGKLHFIREKLSSKLS